MKKKNIVLLITLILFCQSFCTLSAQKSKANDPKMDWWKEARFGMFIHWGLYSIPAGEWKGEKTPSNNAEWILNDLQIPVADYKALASTFNPTRFDAEAFVLLAKEAGMKYIVFTAKHHEGFAMFKSSDPFNVVDATPYQKNIVKALSEACKKYGMRFGLYYSQAQDWTHPGGGMYKEHWDKAQEGSFDKYLDEVAIPQVKEILSAYNPDIIWWDTPTEMTRERAAKFAPILGKHPQLITNNRLGGEVEGDLETPEQFIPATGYPNKNWESCMTINNTWGYKTSDQNWKSASTLITNLIDIASKGGNYLLNVGPTPEGLIPQPSIDHLKKMGEWLKVNGDAIYGTTASPFSNIKWGRVTQKSANGITKLYLHVFDWPTNGQLVITGLGNEIIKAYPLASPKTPLETTEKEADKIIDISNVKPDEVATVIAIEIKGKPVVYEAPTIESGYSIYTNSVNLTIHSNVAYGEKYTTDGSNPTFESSMANGVISLTPNGDVCIKARTFVKGKPVSDISTINIKQVKPIAATYEFEPGLNFKYYEGRWEKVPDFLNLTPVKTGTTENFGLSLRNKNEGYGIVYEGYINVPETNVYAFFLTTDDGSKLMIDDQILDNDNPHPMTEKRIDVALAKGLHKIAVHYFQNNGDSGIKLEWKSNKMVRQEVSKEALSH